MLNEDISEINIIYDFNRRNKEEKDYINIFGSNFVKNNKNICRLIIDNKEYELKEKFNIKEYKNKILNIKLKEFENITDMSEMFDGCSSLLSLPDISKWNIKNVKDINCLFNGLIINFFT